MKKSYRFSKLLRSTFIAAIGFLVFVTGLVFADEWKASHGLISPTGVMNLPAVPQPEDTFFPGPSSPADTDGWLSGLKAWRADRLTRLRYDGSQYARPELEWTQHVFSQVQVLIWDRSFYDPQKQEYTVDKFLSGVESRLGPIDAVLIWHVYPNIGVDDRNQFDLLRDLPGGVPGLRKMVQQFHDRNIKVFFPTLAWDTGTREEGPPAWMALSQLLKEIGADGINFDTLESVPAQFRRASDAIGHPLALEPQFDERDQSLEWSNIAWNDWVAWEGQPYPFVPMVSRSKWLEPRHMVNVTDRFTQRQDRQLAARIFQRTGLCVARKSLGILVRHQSEHDAEAILRFTRIERAFARNLSKPGVAAPYPDPAAGSFRKQISDSGKHTVDNSESQRVRRLWRTAHCSLPQQRALLRSMEWQRTATGHKRKFSDTEFHHRRPGIWRGARHSASRTKR